MKTPHLLTIIASTEVRGIGITGNLCREVQQHHTLDGKLLMERDEWQEREYARIVLEHQSRGVELDRFKRIFDEAQADCAKLIARNAHLEQCQKNYAQTVKELQAKLGKKPTQRQRRTGR